MNTYKNIGIPNDFAKLLPDLKAKTLSFSTICHSGTKINNYANISYYQAPGSIQYGNIILSPGLATNTDIDPLMNMFTFWGLKHHYNIITFNTFLGNFFDIPSLEQAQKNTYPEFVSLLETCIRFIEPYTINQQNILVGHSLGATGLVNTLNNIANKNESTNMDSVMLFAPWIDKGWFDSLQAFIYNRCKINNFNNPYNILPIPNVLDAQIQQKSRYISVMPDFFIDMQKYPFRPDLMNKWNTHTTIIAGAKDKKSPVSQIQSKFEELTKQPNKHLFEFIVLPDEKHCFIQLYQHKTSVINLIKSQSRKIRQ